MKLYEINEAIESAIDMETGEILNPDLLSTLQMERQEKLANIALLAKNKAAEVDALKREEASFKARRMAAERTLAWCKETLQRELHGERLEDDRKRFTVSYRKSEAVRINDADLIPPEYMREISEKMKESLVDKAAIKSAITAGRDVPGASLEERQSIVIR